MADVFVSYASRNEALVRKVIDEIGPDVPIWFAPLANAIPGGTDFAEKIVKALDDCKVLLLMVTREAFESKNVLRELQLATDRNKPIIPLFLEPDLVPPEGFQYRLALEQHIDVYGSDSDWRRQVRESFVVQGVTLGAAEEEQQLKPKGSRQVRTTLMPYLADRKTQEDMIEAALEAHITEQPHTPIIVVMHAEKAQCIDSFVERLVSYGLQQCLGRINRSSQLEAQRISWPPLEPAESPPPAAASNRRVIYCREVARRLDLPPSATPEAMARHIGNKRRPTVFHSLLGADEWTADEPLLIKEVLWFWSTFPDVLTTSQPLIVILAISYRTTRESVLQRLFTRRRGIDIPRFLDGLAPPPSGHLRLVRLPELISLTRAEIHDWVHDVLQPADPGAVLRFVDALFSGRRKDAEDEIRALKPRDVEEVLRVLHKVFDEGHVTNNGAIPMEPLAPVLKGLQRAEATLRGF